MGADAVVAWDSPESGRLLDLIYDAPYDDALWPEILGHVADLARAEPANILRLHVVEGHGNGISARAPDTSMATYFSRWAQANPLALIDDLPNYAAGWTHRILRDSEWLNRAEFERSAYLNEFLVPIGAAYNLTLRLSLDGPWLTSIGLGRSGSRGDFEDEHLDALAPYYPHLVRADRVRRTLALRQAEFERFDHLLDHAAQAMFFLDEELNVARWSAAADTMLRSDDPLLMRGRRLHARNAAVDRTLQAALTRAVSGGIVDPLVLPAGKAGAGCRVAIDRLGERSGAALEARCLLVTVQPVEPPTPSPDRALRARFALTAAEAQLALGLLEGASLREIAERKAVSIHTIRNQLSTIFDKTDCRRQQDLVRLLSGVVAAGPAH